jgi:hypothetical protein
MEDVNMNLIQEKEEYLKRLAEKVTNNEKLTFLDHKIIGLQKSYEKGLSSEQWVQDKIYDLIKNRREFLDKNKSR